MSLALVSKGFEKEVRIGYGSFNRFRVFIAKSYSKKHGDLYSQLIAFFGRVADDFEDRWNVCNDEGLDLLLFHSDCDGVIKPKEAKMIYDSLSKLTVDFGGDPFFSEFYEHFLELLKHSYKRRVYIYFY
jgi:hypothetical protein